MTKNPKSKIISLLRKGKDLEDIARTYNVSKDTVKAYKSHLTMGTYDRSYKKQYEKRNISKEALVELIRFGIPDTLLLAKYKGLKPSNLHAYKAHITMGNYD